MMKKQFAFLVSVLIPILSVSQSVDARLQKVDSIFNSWNSIKAPGGVVAIVDKGLVIYKKAFGMADINRKEPNAIETQFELASVAKQFTAMCIALLEEREKISSEDDIRKFFPEFNFGETVRVKHLLNHSSGIREGYVLALLAGKVNLKGEIPKRRNTERFMLDMLSRERDLNFTPGNEMVYTNVNFFLLGEIVERVSGQSLQKFSDSAIFKPLGMANTFVRDVPDLRGVNESQPYLAKKKRFKKTSKLGGIVGDHNLVTTVDDMIRWVSNFRTNRLGEKDPSLIRKITSMSFLNNGDSARYNYGLYNWIDRGVLKIGHGGDDGGHTCIVTTYPEHDLAVIVLANSSRYGETETKGDKAAEIFLGKYFRKVNVDASDRFVSLSKEEREKKVGNYYRIKPNGTGEFHRVHLKDTVLFMSGSLYHDGIKLSAVTSDYLIFKNAWGAGHANFTDSAGTTLLTFRWRDQPSRTLKPIDKNLKVSYGNYRGAFWNESTNATIKVKRKKTKILARKGIIKIPLIPFEKDLFYAPQHDALFIFGRDESGRVNRLKINAGDFRNFRLIRKN
jgi:CubicO group peptidase (beta-lactamase class C family)